MRSTVLKDNGISADGVRGRLHRALALRRALARTDSGQALVLTLIAVLLIALLVPVIVSNVISEDVNSTHGVDFESALASAEAGVQQYRNLLDVDSNYWRFTSANLPSGGDPALASGGWQQVANSNPNEWFHYLPNTAFLPTGSASTTSAVMLTVTGRSGGPGGYSYRTIQVTFQTTGLLTDAYFSQYETLDPQQDTAAATVTSGAVGSQTTTILTPYVVSLPASVPYTGGTTANLWGALCQYDNWQPNLFVDGLGTSVSSGGSGGTAIANPYKSGNNYNATFPYYGPWRGNRPDSSGNNNTFTYSSGSGSSAWSVNVQDPCGPVYNFVAGENFGGPVYSDDEPWICNPGGRTGSGPTFSDGIEIGGMPATGFPFAYSQWPAQPKSTAPGWLDDGPLNWDGSCGGGSSSSGQSFGTAGVRGVPQVSPQNVDTALLSQAKVTGCVYTGPTMIEFVKGGTFNVWSPESAGTTTGFGSDAGACGTFSTTTAAGAFQTNLSIPSSGLVIYTTNLASSVAVPSIASYVTVGQLPTGSTCLNPWKPYSPATAQVNAQTCGVVSREGDAVVEGEVDGQVTLGAQNNIIISRNITYQCADAAGSVTSQQSASYVLPNTCYTEATPDVLGLVANGDVVISKPASVSSGTNQTGFPGTCAAETSGGGCSPTTVPTGTADDNVPTQTEPYEWPAIDAPGYTYTAYCGQQGVGTQDGTETPQTVWT